MDNFILLVSVCLSSLNKQYIFTVKTKQKNKFTVIFTVKTKTKKQKQLNFLRKLKCLISRRMFKKKKTVYIGCPCGWGLGRWGTGVGEKLSLSPLLYLLNSEPCE